MISESLTKKEGVVYRIENFIIKKSKLIVSKQVGLIEVDQLINSMKELHAQSDFSTDYNFLIDLRLSEFSRNINEVRDFVSFMKANFSISLLNRIAFLTSESEQVAMAVVFKMLQDNQARNMRVFSTLGHALVWLHVDMRVEQMEYYLE